MSLSLKDDNLIERSSFGRSKILKDILIIRRLDQSKDDPSRNLTSFESQFERCCAAHLSRLRVNILRADFRQHCSSAIFRWSILSYFR
ncbi:hypothetical protein HanRHA438_Chr14g0657971 [Helianthus annuus]|nr:hypothetical protein HanRHA438_Chr14g0657971 [Helianthus annuus]